MKNETHNNFFGACSRDIPQILFFLVSFKEVVCFMRSKYLDSNIFMQIIVLIDFQHINCFSVGKILAENMFTSYFLLPALNKIGLQRFHTCSKLKLVKGKQNSTIFCNSTLFSLYYHVSC